jgi:hypothetical protein
MRRRLIEALTYPRLFILENMSLDECPQDGRFEASCKQCRDCDLGQECHWMSCLNNFDELATKPIHTIHASLLYSINLIEARNEQLQHDSETCTCESCTWTRDALELSLEFTNKFAWVFSTDHTTSA